MIYQIFVIHDDKAHAHMVPYFIQHQDLAIRAFATATKQKGTPIGDNPEDFRLYHIGEYDDSTALITPMPRKLVTTGDSFNKG